MSALTLSISIAAAVAAACGGWKGALWWHQRTRDARNEDPRDQEVRELGAALSIARKELAKTDTERQAAGAENSELQNKLQHLNAALSDTQQKYNATRETLNHEIEQREELVTDNGELRRELDRARTRVTELEIQIKTEAHGSGMVAGLDVMEEDSEQLTRAQERITELEAEAARWKQHCVVMTKTNKALRADMARLQETAAREPALAELAMADTGEAPSRNAMEHANGHAAEHATAVAAPAADAAPTSLQKDDLQSIRGIGAKLEQKLHLLGIFSYRELINIDASVYERANLVLPGLEQRIERDSWLEQARALHLEKYSEVI